jgi:hypothetical protein
MSFQSPVRVPELERGLQQIRLWRRQSLYVSIGFFPFAFAADYVLRLFSAPDTAVMYNSLHLGHRLSPTRATYAIQKTEYAVTAPDAIRLDFQEARTLLARQPSVGADPAPNATPICDACTCLESGTTSITESSPESS